MPDKRKELFESASVPRAYFSLTIPSVLGKIVMLLYNMADTWFVAATDDPALVAGVAICGPVFMLMLAVGDIFGMGGSSVISRLYGKGELDKASRVSVFCFYGAMAGGILMAAVMLIFQEPILGLLGADAGTMPHAAAYYRWIALGAPLIVTPVVPLNLLRSEGMAKSSMVGSAVGSAANIILDPIFIFTFGMGAAGAAVATVLSNVASLGVYLFAMRKAKIISAAPGKLTWNREDVLPVFSIGMPASVNNLMNSFGQAVTNRFLLLYGSTMVAAAGIASKINMIPVMMIVGFAFSAAPLIGYNYGQGNRARLKKILRFFYTFQVSMATAVAVVLMLLAPVLVRSFMEDPAIVEAGTQYLRMHLIGMPFMAVVMVSSCLMQATGNAKNALILSLGRQGVVYIATLVIANYLLGYFGVISAQSVADCISAVLAAVLIARSVGREMKEI